MENSLFLVCLFTLPLFGKVIDFNESTIFYSLPSILIFYTVFIKKLSLKLNPKPLTFSLLLIFLFFISALLSNNFGNSYYFLFIFLNCFLMIFVSLKNIPFKEFKTGLPIAAFIFSLVFLLDKTGLISLKTTSLNDNFIKQIYGHSYLADFLVLTLPIAVFNLIPKTTPLKKTLNYLLLLFFLTVLILTNSRSAVFSLIIGMLFFIPQNKIQKNIKKVLIILSVFFLLLSFNPHYQNKFEKTVNGDRGKYWSLAFSGFLKSPFFGNGPNSFPLIRKSSNSTIVTTNLAHNSLLNFLCENGIFFTLILCTAIFWGLKNNFQKNNLIFVSAIIAIIHSLLDPTWNSPGILVISFYLIFQNYPLFYQSENKQNNQSIFIFILAAICFLFSIFDGISNNLLINKNYQLSLNFNPFNLDSRLEIISDIKNIDSPEWQKNLEFTLKYFSYNPIVYQKLIDVLPFPKNEIYYHKLFDLSFLDSYPYYLPYINHIKDKPEKLENFLIYLDQNFQEKQIPSAYAKPLSKISYHYAVKLYSLKDSKSIQFFHLAVKLFPVLGYYQVDLANALWHFDQKPDAINQLTFSCQKYSDPKIQCQDYLIDHRNRPFNQPGTNEYLNYINENIK